VNYGSAEDGVVIRPVTQVADPSPEMGTTSIGIQCGGYGLKDKQYNSLVIHKS